MAGKPLTKEDLRQTINAFHKHGTVSAAATALGLPRNTYNSRLERAKSLEAEGRLADHCLPPPFEIPELPDKEMPIDDLRAHRRKTWEHRNRGELARQLIPVKINLEGPIGILHFGDPHIDDDGCNFPKLEADVKLCHDTEGLFAGNVGDLHNNWIGRLARLYGAQSTSASQAWKLVAWFVRSLNWLYIIKGNHDLWSGSGDPLDFIKSSDGLLEAHGARLNLRFPNGKEVRVNARHDFAGHSMWNPNHGPVKAIKAGWRDHLLTCGHKHETGFGPPLKDPATGLISWPIRCAGYKVHDDYGNALGLPNQNIAPSILTVIDPSRADDDPSLVVPFLSVEEGVEFLVWKRKRFAHGRQ